MDTTPGDRAAAADIGGVYVATVTPFGPTGAIDRSAFLGHIEWLQTRGVRGIVPFGTTGEGPSVALREKLAVLDELFSRGLRLQILPAVMQGNLPDTLELVRVVAELPATAVVVLPPYYYKPVGADGLRAFLEPVVEASVHPVILYHIPRYAVPIPPELVGALAVWGVKDSGGEAGYAEAVLAQGRGVLSGTEDDLWRRLRSGASGMISALANAVPEPIVELFELARRGDAARGEALAARLAEVRAGTKVHAAPAVLKRLAQIRHGLPMGGVRPPLLPVPADYDGTSLLRLAGVL